MNTAMLTIALSSAFLGAEPSWQNDYYKAQAVGVAQKKPLALVFGSGQSGWTKAAAEGKLDAPTTQLMADSYVCVFVDTGSAAGKKLAETFDIPSGVGLVLSDRTGQFMAFWHNGQLSNQNMRRYLQKYADLEAVGRTETVAQVRTSFYPSNGAADSQSSTYCPS